MSEQKKYKIWTRIPWDGNPALKLECWRKSFSRGHVSVGIGEFKTIVYSYGASSEDSISSTRRRSDTRTWTEEEAMLVVDENKGKWTGEKHE